MSNNFEVTFLGTNGSCAYNNGRRNKYGTNTICLAVKVGEETIIFDSGSGICGFDELESYQREHLRLFFSHYHIDHFSGLLFFSQLFDNNKRFDIYGAGSGKSKFYSIVYDFLSPPLHPVGISSLGARLDFHTIYEGQTIELSKDVVLKTCSLSHPGGVIGYRIEHGGKSLCYCTDVELKKHENDSALLEFTKDTDLLIIDSFFDDGEEKEGWGHSSWREGAEWAIRAGVKKLALFHYEFTLADRDIEIMEEKAQKIFPNTVASRDGMRIEL
ncbi:MAG: MBL fold metallo-hydrolase [Oscillospiraceae bacterium]|nr:MBL fold metallo-hydrolase [Oscillospiraceae bacterium]